MTLNVTQGLTMRFVGNSFAVAALAVFLLGATGCTKETKKYSNAEARTSIAREDLLKKRDQAIIENSPEKVALALEQLVLQHSDAAESKSWRLQLASTYLALGSLELAYRVYRDYTKLFPSDEFTEEAFYQAVLARYKQTVRLRSECDTSEATKTVNLCNKYLAQPSYQAHRDDVQDLKSTCENRIINKQIYIFDNYLSQGKLASAKTRLDSFKEEFAACNSELEPQVLLLECKLARAEKRLDDVKNLCASLQEKYPHSAFTKMAQGQFKASA